MLSRITPAWAGKRSTLTRCYPAIQDHPRAGREKQTDTVYAVLPYGSSPRMRGKAVRTGIFCLCFRITPAWAGKSRTASRETIRIQDHPRMGGEKANGSDAPDDDEGSPPHRRGKGYANYAQALARRITPAWAGKSLFCFTAAVPIQDHPRMGGEKGHTYKKRLFGGGDHPRMGGEKPGVCYTQCAKRGSPPHGRGKGTAKACRSWLIGITPAWAGKSKAEAGENACPEDHPRMGGEKTGAAWRWLMVTGSPPHGRGKVAQYVAYCWALRITPAWAGKSAQLQRSPPLTQDHPRMGGEKSWPCVAFAGVAGSPPHGRGKDSAPPPGAFR